MSTSLIHVFVIIAITGAVFWPGLYAPLVHDDYTHLMLAAQSTWKTIVNSFFIHPQGGDDFFRPLGYISYWFDYRWAGADPFRWHLWNLGFHIINSLLVYVLARQLFRSSIASLFTGLLFAIHGTRPEVVCWMAARFDLLAAFFSLLCLIASTFYCKTSHARWLPVAGLCCLLALLSKESAFVIPLLAACLVLFFPPEMRRNVLRCAILFAGIAVIVFIYRSWLLHGIGGYKGANGIPTILDFNLLRKSKALFFRQWAILFFPINWSVSAGPLIALAAVGFFLFELICLAQFSLAGVDMRKLWGAMLMIFAAILPVQHLLLIGQDLSGARVLYLPMIGFAMFWGVLLQGVERSRHQKYIRYCFGHWMWLGVLLFQVAVLNHNVKVWRETAYLSQ
ncbi:MAG: hypothetical protein ACRD63_13915, partial [Pyrinomonadaceae bacterium]